MRWAQLYPSIWSCGWGICTLYPRENIGFYSNSLFWEKLLPYIYGSNWENNFSQYSSLIAPSSCLIFVMTEAHLVICFKIFTFKDKKQELGKAFFCQSCQRWFLFNLQTEYVSFMFSSKERSSAICFKFSFHMVAQKRSTFVFV